MLFEKGKPKTGGRKPGVTNKRTALLKDAILAAAEKAGGDDMVAYLVQQAKENPVAFLGLVGPGLAVAAPERPRHPRPHHLGHLLHRRHQGTGRHDRTLAAD